MPYNIFEGQRVRLRAVEPSDIDVYRLWAHDSEAARAEDAIPFPAGEAEVRGWVEREAARREDEMFFFVIETLDKQVVGRINSHSVEPRQGTFMFALVILEEHRRKGYAAEAIWLLLRYYFEERRYQKCTSMVYAFNEPSIRLHERLGFQLEGRIRQMVYTRGAHHDLLMFGITKDEFAARGV
jgi:RimJ/RimL family protein N-acetyltransferase